MAIREMRLKANKSVQDVMDALNVSDAAVYSWEMGTYKPKADNLIKLAGLFNCSIDDLVKEEGE